MMVSLVKELKEFEEDFVWLNKHYDELKEKYPEEYVAVFGRRVIDHDPGLEELMKRLKEKYPEDSDKVAIKYVTKRRFEMVL